MGLTAPGVRAGITATSITVGMPVYNAMPYLPEAIESLLRQTCPNFEILVIVDGATDASLEYLQSVNDPRLRILIQPNRGVTPTLNRLLRECRTPWLVRQDADDVSHPRRIGRLLNAIHATPDVGMFYSFADYYPHGSMGSFRSSRGTPSELRRIVLSGYLPAICHPTVALHVEKTRALGGYRVGLDNEDADLWWRMALRHDIRCIPEALVGFRQHEGSVSARNLGEQAIAALYVQYLLLSHLTRRAPRAFAVVKDLLRKLVSSKALRAKEHLRASNMCLAEHRPLRASASLLASAGASPGYLLRRLRDELLPRDPIQNGIAPQRFFECQEELWP